MSEMTREDHILWAQTRAREYFDQGDLLNAVNSMASDIAKHQAFQDPVWQGLALAAARAALEGDHSWVRGYIDGFR